MVSLPIACTFRTNHVRSVGTSAAGTVIAIEQAKRALADGFLFLDCNGAEIEVFVAARLVLFLDWSPKEGFVVWVEVTHGIIFLAEWSQKNEVYK